jgi:excisionase family DNA binding protein
MKPAYMTGVQAAKRLGTTPTTLYHWLRRLGLGEKVGRDWLVTESDLDAIRPHLGHKGGRPRKRGV